MLACADYTFGYVNLLENEFWQRHADRFGSDRIVANDPFWLTASCKSKILVQSATNDADLIAE
jgi:hypothetical protein